MNKLVRSTLCLVALATSVQAFAATPADFYRSLLRRGAAEVEAGRASEALTPLRLAAFGLVESIPEYETALVYLVVAHDRLKQQERVREAAQRILAAERVERRFASLTLPVAVRSAFDAAVRKVLTTTEVAALTAPPAAATRAAEAPGRAPDTTTPAPESTSRQVAESPGRTPPVTTPAPATTQPSTTRPAPQTTAPTTTAPSTTRRPEDSTTRPAPTTTAPQTTAPTTTAPSTTRRPEDSTTRPAPTTTAPQTTVPQTTPPQTTAPTTTAPSTTRRPEESTTRPAPTTTAPQTTAPQTTPPQTTAPTTTAPSTTRRPEDSTTRPAPTTTQPSTTRPAPGTTTPSTTRPQPQNTRPATPPPARPAVDVPSRLAAAERALIAANLVEARRIYRELLDLPNLDRDSAIRVAEGLYRSRDFAGTLAGFQRAGALRAGEEPYRYYIAVALYETGQHARARQELAAALPYIELTPDVQRYRAKIEAAR